MPDILTKADLRTALRRRRIDYTGREEVMGQLLVMTLMVAEHAAPQLSGATVVAGYVSNGVEVDPLPLLFRAIDMGLPVVLPRVAEKGAPLDFHEWVPGDALESGPLGIVQPLATAPRMIPDLILAPLVGFDRALNRLGQGGGYYDRTFAALPQARRVGLAWGVQEVPELPVTEHDLPLHGVATEAEWIGG